MDYIANVIFGRRLQGKLSCELKRGLAKFFQTPEAVDSPAEFWTEETPLWEMYSFLIP